MTGTGGAVVASICAAIACAAVVIARRFYRSAVQIMDRHSVSLAAFEAKFSGGRWEIQHGRDVGYPDESPPVQVPAHQLDIRGTNVTRHVWWGGWIPVFTSNDEAMAAMRIRGGTGDGD
jgi:hypothetical protein